MDIMTVRAVQLQFATRMFLLLAALVPVVVTDPPNESLINVVHYDKLNCSNTRCNDAYCRYGQFNKSKNASPSGSCALNEVLNLNPESIVKVLVSWIPDIAVSSDDEFMKVLKCEKDVKKYYNYIVLVEQHVGKNHRILLPNNIMNFLNTTDVILVSGSGQKPLSDKPHSCAYNDYLNSPQVIVVGAESLYGVATCSAILVAQRVHAKAATCGLNEYTFIAALDVASMLAELKIQRPDLSNIDLQYLLRLSTDGMEWTPTKGWGHVDRDKLFKNALPVNWYPIQMDNLTSCNMTISRGLITFPSTIQLNASTEHGCNNMRNIFRVNLHLLMFSKPENASIHYNLDYIVMDLISPRGTVSQLTGVCTDKQDYHVPPRLITSVAFMNESFMRTGWKLQFGNRPAGCFNTNLTSSVVLEAVIEMKGLSYDPSATTTTTTTSTTTTSTTTATTPTDNISTNSERNTTTAGSKNSMAEPQKSKFWLIGVLVVVLVLVIVIVLLVCWCKRRNRHNAKNQEIKDRQNADASELQPLPEGDQDQDPVPGNGNVQNGQGDQDPVPGNGNVQNGQGGSSIVSGNVLNNINERAPPSPEDTTPASIDQDNPSNAQVENRTQNDLEEDGVDDASQRMTNQQQQDTVVNQNDEGVNLTNVARPIAQPAEYHNLSISSAAGTSSKPSTLLEDGTQQTNENANPTVESLHNERDPEDI